MSSPIGVPNLSYKDKAYNLYQDYKLEKFPQLGAARTVSLKRLILKLIRSYYTLGRGHSHENFFWK
jgi:hypothetical protein